MVQKAKRTKKTAKPKKSYVALPGATFTDDDAAIIGPRLKSLKRKIGGPVSPEAILEDAESEESPLHRFFQWDNTAAAHEWRKHQARQMANHVAIKIVSAGGTESTIRAFHSITITTDAGEEVRGYVCLESVQGDPEMAEQVVAAALRWLRGWIVRHKQYQEVLKQGMEAIREALDESA